MTRPPAPLSLFEVLGLSSDAPRHAWLALRGDPTTRPSRFGISSLRIFTPTLALATWAGRRVTGRSVPVTNLVNRTPTSPLHGWSVRVTQVRDFRGRALTYDSHNGTDFAIPPGTRVVAPAPGRVVSVRNEFNRGGLKVYIDHGGGLLTSSHHLARVLVQPGQDVQRGEVVALSGYSGIDALVSFPWVAPHVHFNVMLGGVLVDPFAAAGETSLWRTGNAPTTFRPTEDVSIEQSSVPTRFDARRVAAVLERLRHEERRTRYTRIDDLDLRGWALAIEGATFPTRFDDVEAVRALFGDTVRAPVLDLPFSTEDYDSVVFADDAGLRDSSAP